MPTSAGLPVSAAEVFTTLTACGLPGAVKRAESAVSAYRPWPISRTPDRLRPERTTAARAQDGSRDSRAVLNASSASEPRAMTQAG